MDQPRDISGEPLDVLIVGAGMSGIGMACYLARELPDKRYAIAESRQDMGGTWSFFKYPGIRSDSDLYTFAFEFKPWTSENAIASAEEIMAYVREAARENNVDRHIHFGTEVVAANWDSATGLWDVTLRSVENGANWGVKCRWLFGATGYYDYAQGFRPDFADEDRFQGQLVHAQHWPEDLDISGKKIAVIGSGATAVTIVPALAEQAEHVTQVQRTPSYIVPLPQKDGFASLLQRLLPAKRAHRIMRWRNSRLQLLFYWLYQTYPRFGRWHIGVQSKKHLPKDYPYDVHFNPPYEPWDQRLCVVPDADLFKAISSGKASMTTGTIAKLTESGIQMASGETVQADIIVMATGLNIKLFGGMKLSLDGTPVDPSSRLIYKGMMMDGVPNYSFAVGYTNSSWTLKIGIMCKYLVRLFKEMDQRGTPVCTVEKPQGDQQDRPLMDFGAGYIQRALHLMPRQGDAHPWTMSANYARDAKRFETDPIVDDAMVLSAPETAASKV